MLVPTTPGADLSLPDPRPDTIHHKLLYIQAIALRCSWLLPSPRTPFTMSLASVQLCRCIITIAAAVLEQRPSLLIVDQSDIPFPVSQANLGISLLPPHRLQMPQHRQVTVHEAAHAVRHAARLFARQAARRDAAAGDALLEAGFGEFVDCCEGWRLVWGRFHGDGRRSLLRWKLASCCFACMNCCRSRWSEGERRWMSSCEMLIASSPASMVAGVLGEDLVLVMWWSFGG